METRRGEERKGICVHSELSKDSPSTSVQWGTAVHWLDDIRGLRRFDARHKAVKGCEMKELRVYLFSK